MMNYVKIRCNQYIKHIEDCFAAIFRFTKYFPPCFYIHTRSMYHFCKAYTFYLHGSENLLLKLEANFFTLILF